YDLGEIAQKHRQAGADLWIIREKYLSLLTDLRLAVASLDEIRSQRDQLAEDLHAVYTGAPSTNYKAYIEAQKALKELEDMTFSDEEIDAFLPRELKRK
ncbi:TPA: SLATT domain-containing protein, partial [Pseudomonas aeruginosa]|nr:SLATT domain-containing protein [Pseudomonas aeruginosa]